MRCLGEEHGVLGLPAWTLWTAAALSFANAILAAIQGHPPRSVISLAEVVLFVLLAWIGRRAHVEGTSALSIRSRMTAVGIGALLIALISFGVVLLSLTGGINASATGLFLFVVTGVLGAFIGIATLMNRKKVPKE
jgi:hypothetical protein